MVTDGHFRLPEKKPIIEILISAKLFSGISVTTAI